MTGVQTCALPISRADPDGVNAEIVQVAEPGRDAPEVAHAVAVRIGERAGIDLVDDGVAPPRGHGPALLAAAIPRLVIAGETGSDSMTLRCEIQDQDEALEPALIASIRDVTKLRGEIDFVAAGSLPNDGKIIDDTRKYQ